MTWERTYSISNSIFNKQNYKERDGNQSLYIRVYLLLPLTKRLPLCASQRARETCVPREQTCVPREQTRRLGRGESSAPSASSLCCWAPQRGAAAVNEQRRGGTRWTRPLFPQTRLLREQEVWNCTLYTNDAVYCISLPACEFLFEGPLIEYSFDLNILEQHSALMRSVRALFFWRSILNASPPKHKVNTLGGCKKWWNRDYTNS